MPPFEVRARILGPDGAVLREHRFLGVLTPRALNAEITTTPVLRLTVQTVLATLGAAPDTYTGQRAMDLLATYPREELFWAPTDLVVDVVSSVLQLASRRRLRAFLQPDPFGRFVSVMVFLPRDRYTTDCRLAMQQILLDAFDGTGIRYTARVGDSLLAAVHFTVSTDPAQPVAARPDGADQGAARRPSAPGTTGWSPRSCGGDEDLDTAGALSRYADAFDEALQGDLPGRGRGRRPAAAGRADRAGRSGADDGAGGDADDVGGVAAQAVRHRRRGDAVPGAAGAAARSAPRCWTSGRSRSAGPTEPPPASTISG